MIPLKAELKYRLKDFRKILSNNEESADLRSRFVKNVTGIFGLNVVSNGLLFILSLILARLLGSEGYGVYVYALALIMVLGIAAQMGIGGLLVRNVAAFKTKSAWGHMAGIFSWANRTVLLSSLCVAFLAGVVLFFLRARLEPEMLSAIAVALVLLPLTALMRIRRATLHGLYHLARGELPEMIFNPVLFIALLGAGLLVFHDGISPARAIEINVVATGVSLVIIMFLLRKYFPRNAREAAPIYEKRQWSKNALSMMLVGGMYVINSRTDILMLGAISGPEAAGIYNAVSRGSELIMFILTPVHQTLRPTVAALYAEKDFARMQHIITKTTRFITWLSLPLVIALVTLGHWFLLLYGRDFTQGHLALSILSIGQLLNIALGPVALLLIMTSYERDAAVGIGIGAGLNVILNALLIPKWGLEGAAIATISSKILWSVFMSVWVVKRLKIHSTVFGKFNLTGQR